MHMFARTLLCFACCAISFFNPPLHAAEPTKNSSTCALVEHGEPEYWVINSRCAPRCSNLDSGFEKLKYQRWSKCENKFLDMSREDLLQRQAELPTFLFIHGNSLNHENALKSTWPIYERLKVCPGKKLFVLWSWPAEAVYNRPLITPIKLVRKNVRTKYSYAEHQGYYVAKLTQMMSTVHPLTVGGHSFGAACACVASHYLGGGVLNGRTLLGGSPELRPNLRMSLISPALDNDHLYPGHRYEKALFPIEKMHTTFSSKDATLKRWPTHSLRNQQAMGFTGICATKLGVNAHKLCQQRLTEDVGRSHYIKEHFASLQMISEVCSTAFNSTPVLTSKQQDASRSRPDVDLESILKAPVRLLVPAVGL